MRAPVFDYYAVLGVDRGAAAAQLRRAYRMLALRFHPDRAGVQSTEVFQRIAEAYGVLSDVPARAAYDARLREAETVRFGRRGRGNVGARAGQGGPAGQADGEIMEGEAYGPGGKISWRRRGAVGDRQRVDNLVDRLCGPLDTLIARGVALRCGDGVVELMLDTTEATTGGTAAIDTVAQVACPTCFGSAHRGRLWCRTCEYDGSKHESVVVCIPIPPFVADGAIFDVATDPAGRAAPMRVRVRVDRKAP